MLDKVNNLTDDEKILGLYFTLISFGWGGKYIHIKIIMYILKILNK